MNYAKLIKALKLAIGELETKRRRDFAPGEHAYQQGIRTVTLNSEGVTGELLSFAEDGHNGYMEYTQAIDEFEDWIEIFSDPGVVIDKAQMELFEAQP